MAYSMWREKLKSGIYDIKTVALLVPMVGGAGAARFTSFPPPLGSQCHTQQGKIWALRA